MMLPKKILVVSYLFAPNNNIGAIRPSKWANMLSKKYTVDVISYGLSGNDSQNVPHCRNIYHMNNKEVEQHKQISGQTKKRDNAVVLELKHTYRLYLSLKNGRKFVDFCVNLYKEKLISEKYDVLITSFGPMASLQCGLEIKKLSPDIMWICDFRDPVVTEDMAKIFMPYMAYLQQKACKKADKIVTVSDGYLKRICKGHYSEKSYMIPNGYDESDIERFDNLSDSSEIMHFVYVGALYEGKRKITPLFRALKELMTEGKIDIDKICFDYGGGEGAFLRAQAEEYGLERIIHDHGILSRLECLKLQYASQLLVLATWNNKGEYGVFPGKFLEYMMIGKPIISLTDGNLSNGEVTQVMVEGNFGIAYEAINDQTDYVKLRDYIDFCYAKWKNDKKIPFSPEREVLERYSYQKIIKHIEELIVG